MTECRNASVPSGVQIAGRRGGASAAAFVSWLAVAGIAIFTLAACGPNAASLAQDAVAGPSGGSSTDIPVAGGNVYGAYLAARIAQSEHDYATASTLMRSVLTADPQNVDLVNRAFVLALSEGRMEQAVPLATEIVQRSPGALLPTLTLLVEDARLGRFDGVRRYADALPVDGLNRFITAVLRSWSLAPQPGAGAGAAAPALAVLAPLADNQAFAPVADLHRALLLDLAGDNVSAEAAYRRAINANPNPPYRVVELVANFLSRTGKGAEAAAMEANFTARNRASPDMVPAQPGAPPPARLIASAKDGLTEALFDVASLLNQAETGDLSLVYARLALVLQPDMPLAQLILADVLEGQHRNEDALAVYRRIDPKSPFGWGARLRAVALVDADGKHDAAEAELRSMAAERPDRPDPLIELGDSLRARDQFAPAADAYTEALVRIGTVEPRHWTIYYSRGIAYERSGQWSKAEADLQRALELQPNQPSVLNYLGYSWVERGEHLDEALKLIERAVQARPNDGFMVDSLGWAYFRLGDVKKASEFLERAVELRPEDAAINDHLGDAYWQVGRDLEARFQWQRALSLNPEPELEKAIALKIDRAPARPVPHPASGKSAHGG